MVANQEILFQKLHVILQRSLVESRNLAMNRNCEQLYDLADTFEIVPTLMTRWKDEDLEVVRNSLCHYQSKYRQTAYDYLSILGMDDAEFQAVFQLHDQSL